MNTNIQCIEENGLKLELDAPFGRPLGDSLLSVLGFFQEKKRWQGQLREAASLESWVDTIADVDNVGAIYHFVREKLELFGCTPNASNTNNGEGQASRAQPTTRRPRSRRSRRSHT